MYIDEQLDVRTEREARRRGISKAALIRQSLLAELGPSEARDSVDGLVGSSDAEAVDDVHEIIYGA